MPQAVIYTIALLLRLQPQIRSHRALQGRVVSGRNVTLQIEWWTALQARDAIACSGIQEWVRYDKACSAP